MLKRLHLLVVKSYIGPLVLTFFIAEFVLIMHFLWLYIEDLVGKGLEWTIIAELLLYSAAGLVKMALPLAVLMASIMTFGNLGENFELSAMKSAGISLQRIMMPLTIFSILLSIGSFFWSNNVIPYTNLKFGSLLYDVSNQRPELNIKPGIFNRGLEGYSIKVKSKNPNTAMMYDFMIYDHTEKKGNPKVTLADSGYMQVTDNQKYLIITLYGGRTFEEISEKNIPDRKYPERHETFEKQTIIVDLKGFDFERTNEDLFKHNYQMKTIAQLDYSQDSLKRIMTQRKNQFISGFERSRYFKYNKKRTGQKEALADRENIPFDTIRTKKINEEADIKKVFSNMSVDRKTQIVKAALESAQNAKSYIESNQAEIKEKQKNISKHEIAWHEKFTLSVACLIFFFIGAPLGAIIRKGGFGLPFLVSIIFFILYYVVSITGRKFVEEMVLLPWQGMWLSSILALPLGIIFTYKATTDSVLFDKTAYGDFFKRPFKVLQLQYKDPTVVFHKNVEMPDNKELHAAFDELEKMIGGVKLEIKKSLRSIFTVMMSLFNKKQIGLDLFIEKYNSLFDVLAVKYRDRIFLKASLEKFPKIELEMYRISDNKKWLYILFMTVFIIPVGLFIISLTYFKLLNLGKKIDLIKDQLVLFKDAPDHV